MAIKLHCGICGTFLKNISADDARKVTGKELCKTCASRVNGCFSLLDDKQKEVLKEIEELKNKAKKEFGLLDKTYEMYVKRLSTIYNEKKTELNELLDHVVEKA